MFLVKPYDVPEFFELHFQPVFINNDDDTKRNKSENLNLRLCLVLKTILTFKYHAWSTLILQGLWYLTKLSNLTFNRPTPLGFYLKNKPNSLPLPYNKFSEFKFQVHKDEVFGKTYHL